LVRQTSRHEQAYKTAQQSRTAAARTMTTDSHETTTITTGTTMTNADPIKLPKSTLDKIMKLAKHHLVGTLFTDKATESTAVERENTVNDAITHATVHIVGAGGRCSLRFESSHSVTDSPK
jgi:hypothetical protein